MRESGDVEGVCAVLEVCLRSNFAGIESFRLYSETYIGTKERIRSYIDEGDDPTFSYPLNYTLLNSDTFIVETSIAFIRNTSDLALEEKAKLFRYISKNNGATALCLSGGASFGYYVCRSIHSG